MNHDVGEGKQLLIINNILQQAIELLSFEDGVKAFLALVEVHAEDLLNDQQFDNQLQKLIIIFFHVLLRLGKHYF